MFIKINETLYPAVIKGKISDDEWDNRESKSITLEMTYNEVINTFIEGVAWSIIEHRRKPVCTESGEYVYDDEGNQVIEIQEIEYDNSEYNLAGDIIDHRDGTITVKMGKLTALEEAYEIMLGGIE